MNRMREVIDRGQIGVESFVGKFVGCSPHDLETLRPFASMTCPTHRPIAPRVSCPGSDHGNFLI